MYLYLGHIGAVYKRLSSLIADIPGIGEILLSVNGVILDDAYNRYLYDFVRMKYQSHGGNTDVEFKVRNPLIQIS